MKLRFRSKDFASIEGAGLGFNNRRPMSNPWQYQGRVQHPQWRGTYECYWDGMGGPDGSGGPIPQRSLSELVWVIQGEARLFGLAAALKARGFQVTVEQD